MKGIIGFYKFMVKSKSHKKKKKAKIRFIALGLIVKDNLIFLSQGYDNC